MEVEEYEMVNDQDEDLELNDTRTKKYKDDNDNIHPTKGEGYEEGVRRGSSNENYGTYKMEELTNWLQIPENIGPKHPHVVGMAPMED